MIFERSQNTTESKADLVFLGIPSRQSPSFHGRGADGVNKFRVPSPSQKEIVSSLLAQLSAVVTPYFTVPTMTVGYAPDLLNYFYPLSFEIQIGSSLDCKGEHPLIVHEMVHGVIEQRLRQDSRLYNLGAGLARHRFEVALKDETVTDVNDHNERLLAQLFYGCSAGIWERITTPYKELFCDLVTATLFQDPLCIANAFYCSQMKELSKSYFCQVSAEQVQEYAALRSFVFTQDMPEILELQMMDTVKKKMFFIPKSRPESQREYLDEISEKEIMNEYEHEVLIGVRPYIWSMMMREDSGPASDAKKLDTIYKAMRAEIFSRLYNPTRWVLSAAEIRKGLLKRLAYQRKN